MNSQIKKLNLKNAKPSKNADKKNQIFSQFNTVKKKTGDYEIGFSFLINRLYTEREKNSAFPLFSQPITLRVF